ARPRSAADRHTTEVDEVSRLTRGHVDDEHDVLPADLTRRDDNRPARAAIGADAAGVAGRRGDTIAPLYSLAEGVDELRGVERAVPRTHPGDAVAARRANDNIPIASPAHGSARRGDLVAQMLEE